MVEGKWHCYHGTNQFFRMQKLAQALEKLDDAPRVSAGTLSPTHMLRNKLNTFVCIVDV